MSVSPNDPIAATRAGTVIFLIDESRGMAAPVAGGVGTKAETVATAVNSMLNQLASGPPVQVAVVGYRASGEGGEASPRWAGPLAGRELVKSEELAAATLSVEDRVRRIPGARGHDPAREESIRFPIWYVPAPGGRFKNAQMAPRLSASAMSAHDFRRGRMPERRTMPTPKSLSTSQLTCLVP